MINLTSDGDGVVHLHADKDGLDYLISSLQHLRDKIDQDICEHDHLMTESWGGHDLSEKNPLIPEDHSMVHHLKIMAWTDEWTEKHGFK